MTSRFPEIPEWLHEAFPFQTRTLDVQGERISFVDEGPRDGICFVLVHGSPTWSFLYRNAVARLRQHARVIALDLVGFGLSSKPADPAFHTLERHISLLTEFLDRLNLERMALVLHGSAGPIGLAY